LTGVSVAGGPRSIAVRLSMGTAAIVSGLGLAILAVPMIAADIALVPVRGTLANADIRMDGSALRRFVDSGHASVAWHEQGRVYTDVALARLILASNATAAARNAELAHAEAALVQGLKLAPASRHGWLRLVQIRLAAADGSTRSAGGAVSIQDAERGGSLGDDAVRDIARPLGLAFGFGALPPPSSLFLAAEGSLVSWCLLDEARREFAGQSVSGAWRRDPLRTATIARRVGKTRLLAHLAGLQGHEEAAACEAPPGAGHAANGGGVASGVASFAVR